MYYVAHRLFAAHDRALAARLADRLAAKAGADKVFLPFCDTDEEDLVAEVKGRRLFELDSERLRRLTAMVAILHGPSLDDGVCMEIGYARALGAPVVVVTSDFQTYSLTEDGPRLLFPDPLIESLADQVVRVERLGPPSPEQDTARFQAFAQRNQDQVDRAVQEAVDAALGIAASRVRASTAASPSPSTAFVELSPYSPYSPEDPTVGGLLGRAGYSVRTSARFRATAPRAAGRTDWGNAVASELLVADVSGPETPSGAAALIGAAAALGRQAIAYQPRPVLSHAHGREPNWRNLMIQYAASAHITSFDELATRIGQ